LDSSTRILLPPYSDPVRPAAASSADLKWKKKRGERASRDDGKRRKREGLPGPHQKTHCGLSNSTNAYAGGREGVFRSTRTTLPYCVCEREGKE